MCLVACHGDPFHKDGEGFGFPGGTNLPTHPVRGASSTDAVSTTFDRVLWPQPNK